MFHRVTPIIAPAATFDPATLALSGWWRASFGGVPWTATASAGASGGNGSLSEGINPPSVGAALNGLTSADFDGTNDKLENANTLDTFLASTGWSISGIIAADSSLPRTVGIGQFDAGLFVQKATGTWGITFTDDGITVFQNDSGINYFEITQACAADGNPHTFHAWFDGTDLHLTVDGSSASPVTTGGGIFNLSGGVPRLGTDYIASFAWFDGRVWDLMTSLVDLGATARTNIESYFQATY